MSETTTPISDASARAAYAGTGVTPSAAQQFAAHVRSVGGDPTTSLQAYGYGPDGAPVQPATPGQATPAPRPIVDDLGPSKTGRLTPAQQEAAAATLQKFWTGDPAVLRAALEGEGMVEVDEADDVRTEAQREFDGTFAGAHANQYELTGAYVGHVGDVGQMAKVDGAMRETLAAMDFPAALAKGFVDDILTATEHGHSAQGSDAEKTLYANDQIAIAVRATHAASRAEFFDTARRAFDLMPEAVKVGLAERGCFESANVLTALYMHGARMAAREGLKAR
jgi:hypothetical protein